MLAAMVPHSQNGVTDGGFRVIIDHRSTSSVHSFIITVRLWLHPEQNAGWDASKHPMSGGCVTYTLQMTYWLVLIKSSQASMELTMLVRI